METLSWLSVLIRERFPQQVIGTHRYRGDDTAILKRDGLHAVCRFLRDDPAAACNVLMDLTCVDYLRFGTRRGSAPTMTTPSPLPYFMTPAPTTEVWQRGVGEEYRFDAVYHLSSLTHHLRVRLKVPITAADPTVDSVTDLWPAANWFEREVWDMFGIRFTGHPNLKRILMYEPFEGHPLRKDYPVYKRQPLIGPVN